jgi:hypothetical protein
MSIPRAYRYAACVRTYHKKRQQVFAELSKEYNIRRHHVATTGQLRSTTATIQIGKYRKHAMIAFPTESGSAKQRKRPWPSHTPPQLSTRVSPIRLRLHTVCPIPYTATTQQRLVECCRLVKHRAHRRLVTNIPTFQRLIERRGSVDHVNCLLSHPLIHYPRCPADPCHHLGL